MGAAKQLFETDRTQNVFCISIQSSIGKQLSIN